MKSTTRITALISLLPLLVTSATAFLIRAQELVPTVESGKPYKFFVHTVGLAPEQALLQGTTEHDFSEDFSFKAQDKTLFTNNGAPLPLTVTLTHDAPMNTTGTPPKYHAVYIKFGNGTEGWSKPTGKGKQLVLKSPQFPAFGSFSLCDATVLGNQVKHLLLWRPKSVKVASDCRDVELFQA